MPCGSTDMHSEPVLRILCPDCSARIPLCEEIESCSGCGRPLRDQLHVLNFVNSPEVERERAFYDQTYSDHKGLETVVAEKSTIASVRRKWTAPESPENAIVLQRVGNLEGKRILLLGNGESVKELAFLDMKPAHLVYSDLSAHALLKIARRFDLAHYESRLTFAAIDAHEIPFEDASFDVVYGFGMVHHLPDLDRFLASVMRVLHPGGHTVFMDDAFAPLWHYSKQTWLKPLMKASHRRSGISPEDYRFSMTGGFKEDELHSRICAAGGEPWFVRTSMLNYLLYRASEKLLPAKLRPALKNDIVVRAINVLDGWICRIPGIRNNQIRLIWGLTKPCA